MNDIQEIMKAFRIQLKINANYEYDHKEMKNIYKDLEQALSSDSEVVMGLKKELALLLLENTSLLLEKQTSDSEVLDWMLKNWVIVKHFNKPESIKQDVKKEITKAKKGE